MRSGLKALDEIVDKVLAAGPPKKRRKSRKRVERAKKGLKEKRQKR